MASPTGMLAPGTKLGPYEIVGALGAGGMGEVYRARDARLDRIVAIKILPAALATADEHLHRFEREARSASALNHPNIVTIHELGRDGSVHFIAMELVEGATVRDLLKAGPVPVRQTIDIAAQIAEGLQSARIRHRASRYQAWKPDGDRRRIREDPRLRSGEARSRRRRVVAVAHAGQLGHALGRDLGYAGIHVARAGQRPPPRFPLRSIFTWPRALRNGDRKARVPPQHCG